jgi:hypothetical protein
MRLQGNVGVEDVFLVGSARAAIGPSSGSLKRRAARAFYPLSNVRWHHASTVALLPLSEWARRNAGPTTGIVRSAVPGVAPRLSSWDPLRRHRWRLAGRGRADQGFPNAGAMALEHPLGGRGAIITINAV